MEWKRSVIEMRTHQYSNCEVISSESGKIPHSTRLGISKSGVALVILDVAPKGRERCGAKSR